MIARNGDRLAALEKELPGSRGFACDVSDPERLAATFDEVCGALGAPEVLLHNAVGGAFGDFLSIDPEVLKSEDRDMLQDLLVAATNEALRKAKELMAEDMKALTGGMPIPGLL